VNPIVAVLLGTVIFNEPLTIPIVIGGSITLVGLYLVNKSMRKN
jgi:drug/metabolite transporter (DMT)-like permease